MFQVPEAVNKILSAFENNGYQAYVVGGCVRDSFLGIAPKDWDIATNALPKTIIDIFGKENTIPTGIKHGTVTVKQDGMVCEVTTFRVDSKYTDSRHPDKVMFVYNIEEDLARRDFTINAMAYNPKFGLIDPFGGQWDLKIHHRIRAVGNPAERFTEDPLRILRALRFSAAFGFSIENKTYNSMVANLKKIHVVSRERVGSELRKIVTGKYASKAMSYDDGRIIRYVIPELDKTFGCAQNNKYHYTDVFHHTMDALKNAETKYFFPKKWADEYVRMALFLHDIGKPSCKTTDDAGNDHFYGHAARSASLAFGIMKRLRFSNKYIDTVVELIKFHDLAFNPTVKCAKVYLNKFGEEQLHRLLKIRECDNQAHTEIAYSRFYSNTAPFAAALEHVIESKDAVSIHDLMIDGRDVISLGLHEGPEIGAVLKALLNEVIEGKTENTRDALIDRCKAMLENINRG